MHISHHADQRMNQRGISRRLVEFTLRHGRIDGDRRVLDRNESRHVIERLTEELRLARQVMDKGGIAVIEGDRGTIVTTYNVDAPVRRPRTSRSMLPSSTGATAGREQVVARGVSCL